MRANVRKASEMKEDRCAIIGLGIVLCGLSMFCEAFMGKELCAYALTVCILTSLTSSHACTHRSFVPGEVALTHKPPVH